MTDTENIFCHEINRFCSFVCIKNYGSIQRRILTIMHFNLTVNVFENNVYLKKSVSKNIPLIRL